MSRELEEAERAYRVVDAMYRLQRGLFAVEAVVAKASHIQIRLVRQTVNGQMGTLVAGLLVLVPILIALGDVKWGSAPAIAIYLVIVGVFGLWGWQIRSAGKTELELAALEHATASTLDDRDEFMLEEINATVIRHRMADAVIQCLRQSVESATDPKDRDALDKRVQRWQEIISGESDYVAHMAQKSLDLVQAGKRTLEEHETLLDWCRGMPNFKDPDDESKNDG
jgi:hypothetical protein